MTLVKRRITPITPKAITPKPMSTKQYIAALDQLGLSHASKTTSALLGISVGHMLKIKAGHPVSKTLQHLLEAWLQIGKPPPWD
jgi:fructose-specific phosphotransferase system IIC component